MKYNIFKGMQHTVKKCI